MGEKMKRIKRFVLAESTETDPIWKSSDNMNAEIAKMNAKIEEEKKEKSSGMT